MKPSIVLAGGNGRDAFALQMHYDAGMKTATIPPVRIEPALREQLEQVLAEGETLSAFVESAVRASVQQRRAQAEFVQRGLASLAAARGHGGYIPADESIERLTARLQAARNRA